MEQWTIPRNQRVDSVLYCEEYMVMRIQLNLEGKRRNLEYEKVDAVIDKTIKKYEEADNII